MADYGASDTSTTTLGNNQFPISEVYVPNVGLKALGGAHKQTDGSSLDYASALFYAQDGDMVTVGLKADTAATDSTSSWSLIALLKGIYAKLAGTLTANINSPTSGTATLANVGSSATAVTLQASNGARKGWYCFNDSTSALYINFGGTASASAFTVKVPAAGFFEMPTTPVYTGTLGGIWDSANGNARVTELT